MEKSKNKIEWVLICVDSNHKYYVGNKWCNIALKKSLIKNAIERTRNIQFNVRTHSHFITGNFFLKNEN